ncbi:hypothetical protein [Nonomuraea soli]|uniref:Uncharacterized protein n=1 Tax=Nonomuraea soli TaxID=1032476 RepID=A0A7W0HVM8_9ACTN|nr:hypothetical protein [Nonomuraea soli]MBA2897368.1 hypothetical protein [Nonomuraea soli]
MSWGARRTAPVQLLRGTGLRLAANARHGYAVLGLVAWLVGAAAVTTLGGGA